MEQENVTSSKTRESEDNGMRILKRVLAGVSAAALLAVPLSACGQNRTAEDSVTGDDLRAMIQIDEEDAPLAIANPTLDGILVPEATGTVTYGNAYAVIDASNTDQGYVMVKYLKNEAVRIKVQITRSGGTTYTYNIAADENYDVFPLSDGDGTYQINVFRNIGGTRYSQVLGQSISVKLSNELLPFLYPNQFANFKEDSKAVQYADQLASKTGDELETVANIYNYVVQNISYDYDLAKNVESTYLPVVDDVLAKGKGICFDYASLLTSMLRSQGIPTKLLVGYTSRGEYHAWISVHVSELGWINNIISFDGQQWKLMDPTFASTGKSSKKIMDFINNPQNYTEKYCY